MLKWGIKWRRFWVQRSNFKWLLFEAWKYYFVFDSRFIFYLSFSKWSFIHNVILTLPNVVKIVVEKGNVHKIDVHKVVSIMIWRCATSRRHINLKTTLKQRWNNVERFVGLSILDDENHVNSFSTDSDTKEAAELFHGQRWEWGQHLNGVKTFIRVEFRTT